MSLCLRLTTLAVTKANPGPITNTGSCSKECRPVSDVPRVSACEWDRRRILQSRYPGLQRPNVSTSFASVSFCDRYKRLAFWEVVLLQHFACPYSQMCTHPSMYPSRCLAQSCVLIASLYALFSGRLPVSLDALDCSVPQDARQK